MGSSTKRLKRIHLSNANQATPNFPKFFYIPNSKMGSQSSTNFNAPKYTGITPISKILGDFPASGCYEFPEERRRLMAVASSIQIHLSYLGRVRNEAAFTLQKKIIDELYQELDTIKTEITKKQKAKTTVVPVTRRITISVSMAKAAGETLTTKKSKADCLALPSSIKSFRYTRLN